MISKETSRLGDELRIWVCENYLINAAIKILLLVHLHKWQYATRRAVANTDKDISSGSGFFKSMSLLTDSAPWQRCVDTYYAGYLYTPFTVLLSIYVNRGKLCIQLTWALCSIRICWWFHYESQPQDNSLLQRCEKNSLISTLEYMWCGVIAA